MREMFEHLAAFRTFAGEKSDEFEAGELIEAAGAHGGGHSACAGHGADAHAGFEACIDQAAAGV